MAVFDIRVGRFGFFGRFGHFLTSLHPSDAMYVTAHVGGSGGRRSGAVESRVVSGRLPHDAVHRVQRRTRHVPLLRQQVQLLAVDDRPPAAVLHAAAGDAESRQPALACQSLPGLHQGGPVGDGRQRGRRRRRRPIPCQQLAIIAGGQRQDSVVSRRRRRSCLKHFRCLSVCLLCAAMSSAPARSLLLNSFRVEEGRSRVDVASGRRMSFLVIVCAVELTTLELATNTTYNSILYINITG